MDDSMNIENKINKALCEDIPLKVIGGHAPAPALWGVLYARPNDDESRKQCSNCALWVSSESCMIHDVDLKIIGDMVCGYHIYGSPSDQRLLPKARPLDPRLSGLELTNNGTSCDNCTYYGDRKCYAVADNNEGTPPTDVNPRGCCARWVGC